MHQVTVVIGPDRGCAFELNVRAAVSIGRCGAQVALTDVGISSLHAELFKHDDGWWVIDLGSKTGTLVNGRSAQRPVRLSRGDQIELGHSILVFHRVSPATPQRCAPKMPPAITSCKYESAPAGLSTRNDIVSRDALGAGIIRQADGTLSIDPRALAALARHLDGKYGPPDSVQAANACDLSALDKHICAAPGPYAVADQLDLAIHTEQSLDWSADIGTPTERSLSEQAPVADISPDQSDWFFEVAGDTEVTGIAATPRPALKDRPPRKQADLDVNATAEEPPVAGSMAMFYEAERLVTKAQARFSHAAPGPAPSTSLEEDRIDALDLSAFADTRVFSDLNEEPRAAAAPADRGLYKLRSLAKRPKLVIGLVIMVLMLVAAARLLF